MTRFSKRMGHVQVRSQLQIESMDADLRMSFYSSMGKAYSVNGSGTFGTFISGIEYNPLEQITKISRSNGIEDRLSYDEDNLSFRLKNIDILNTISFKNVNKKLEKKKTSSSLLSLSYNYDEASNVKEKSDLLAAESEDYSYDELNRLISYSINSTPVQSFEYDQIGNISKMIDTSSRSYIYNNNRKQILSSVSSNSYVFDVFGNISSDGIRTYSFNWENRLKSLTKSGITTDYIYDHEGFRTEKKNISSHYMYLNKYTEIKNGSPLYHIFMDGRRVASVDESNNLSHLHQDHLSSSALRTSSLGNNIYSQKYYPFGDERLSTGALNSLFNLFTGQYKDQESGIYYYGQRYYNPEIGRFITADPLYSEKIDKLGINSQELNLYAYSKNNPINYVDPDGLKSELGQHGALMSINPFQHRTIVLSPDNPKDFQNHPLFKASEGRMATLGGQSSAAIGKEPGFTLARPFGNLISVPNFSGDHPSKLNSLTEIIRPAGMTDTQHIKALIEASEMYKNNAEYSPFPGKGDDTYNSNSYTSGVIEQAGGAVPDMPLSSPGADKSLPLE